MLCSERSQTRSYKQITCYILHYPNVPSAWSKLWKHWKEHTFKQPIMNVFQRNSRIKTYPFVPCIFFVGVVRLFLVHNQSNKLNRWTKALLMLWRTLTWSMVVSSPLRIMAKMIGYCRFVCKHDDHHKILQTFWSSVYSTMQIQACL